MEKRKLGTGKAAIDVSAIGLGCMGLSPFYGGTDMQEARDSVKVAIENGLTFFDVADIYGFGLSEEILGDVIRMSKRELVIATKAGIVIDQRGEAPRLCGTNTTKTYLKKACERSLKRLRLDCIDLYYLHRIDPVTPIEESILALVDLISEGKIKHVGLSEVSQEQIARAHEVYPITAVQSEYSLIYRRPETDRVLETCRKLGIGFVPFSPLGRGFLTGTVRSRSDLTEDDFRRGLPKFTDENIQHNIKLVDAMSVIANTEKVSMAQLALCWLLSKGDDIVPIPGSSSPKNLIENIQSLEKEIDAESLLELDNLFSKDEVEGEQFSKKAHDMFSSFIMDEEILSSVT